MHRKIVCVLAGMSLAIPLFAACATRAEWAKPELVAKVAKGEVSEARVSWWGFDKEDSTKYLQAAISSGVKKLIVDKMDSAWITKPLFAVSGQHITFEPGVLLMARRGEFKGRNDRLLSVDGVSDVKITGYGATFRMWREDYAKGPGYRRGEWRHTLAVCGSCRVTVEGLTLEDSGGDGIYISTKRDAASSRDIVIRDCVCDRHHRQGLSVIGAKNLLIENCVFRNTCGTAPEDGIDFEPNNAGESCENCIVRNCVSENNRGYGFELALSHSRSSTPPCSVVFENCRSTGDMGGVKVRTRVNPSEGDYPKGEISFRGCTFEKTRFNAVEIQQNPANSLSISFDKCTFRRIGLVDKAAPLVMLYSFYVNDPCPAMPVFTDMSWPDRAGKAMKAYNVADFSVLPGETALPLLPLSTEGARVVDLSPGRTVKCPALRMRHRARLVVYADAPRKVNVLCQQSRVGRRNRKAVKGKVSVLDSAGRTVAVLSKPGYKKTSLSFDAPAAGFYSMEMDFGPNAFVVHGTDAPLAVDCTRTGPKGTPLSMIASSGSLFVPLKKGQLAEFRVCGSTPSEKVSFTVTDPAGNERFRDDAVLYWTRANTPAVTEDGLWKLTFGKPSNLSFEDFAAEVAGIVPLLFFSPEKFWYSGN